MVAVSISDGAITLKSGSISEKRRPAEAGGVMVASGTFTMKRWFYRW